MQAIKQNQLTEPLKEWQDLWFTESKKAGYVAIGSLSNPFYYGMNDYHKLAKVIQGKTGCYITLNAFNTDFKENRFTRRTNDLKQIRNIGIDLDQYKLGMTIAEALDILQVLIYENKIPEPNLVLTSRGVQLFYSIEGGASPSMAWLSSYITEQFIEKLEHIGADYNAKDMSRFMRAPGSINERNGAVVEPEIWNDQAYSLADLQSYCRPLNKYKQKSNATQEIISLKSIDKQLILFYRTNHARLRDFKLLMELRKGNLTGMRNVFLYMYAYHQSLVSNSLEGVKRAVKNDLADMYSQDGKIMTEKEVDKTIASAYDDCEKFFNTYSANGYRMFYGQSDGIIKPYTTQNVINKLGITEQEQLLMSTFRNKEIAKQQDKERKRSKRREQGMKPMTEYNTERKLSRLERVQQLAYLITQQPGKTQTEYAELMSISLSTVSRLLKELKE